MAYGVVPEGFSRKPLNIILQEIEDALVTEFGSEVIQTSQSPLGQLNGLFADFVSTIWELGEDIYQSYDVDQAEGLRLDTLAKLRLLRRAGGELDPALRQAITNQDRARVDIPDIERAVAGITGVTYVKVFVNDTPNVDVNLIPSGSICVAVLGGDELEIANAMRVFVVPGITTFGNTSVSALDEEGFCRSLAILRPIIVPVKLTIQVRPARDNYGCPPPSMLAVRDAFIADMTTGANKLLNGDKLDHFRIRSSIERQFPNVEVLSFVGERDGIVGASNQAVEIGFIELATLQADDVLVNAP